MPISIFFGRHLLTKMSRRTIIGCELFARSFGAGGCYCCCFGILVCVYIYYRVFHQKLYNMYRASESILTNYPVRFELIAIQRKTTFEQNKNDERITAQKRI